MLDLIVAAVALLVIGSLGMLTWTLGVSAVGATQQGRRRVAGLHQSLAQAEDRLEGSAAGVNVTLANLVARTTASTSSKPGDEPDA